MMKLQNEKDGILKKLTQMLFADVIAIVFVIIGVILLSLTLVFRVNPVEGSVVNDAIVGTTFHWFLLITTMPAWIAGIIVGMTTFLSFPFMFVFQIIIFWSMAKIVRLSYKTIKRLLSKRNIV